MGGFSDTLGMDGNRLAQRRREFPVRRIVEVPAGYRWQVASPQSLRLFHRLAILFCSFRSLSSGCVSQFQAGILSCCRRALRVSRAAASLASRAARIAPALPAKWSAGVTYWMALCRRTAFPPF